MTAQVPEGFRQLDVPDEFIRMAGPLWAKPEDDGLRIGLPLEKRHGNPMGVAHGGLLVTVADMVMGVGSGFATGIFWPHPTISLTSEFVRGARLGQWLEGKARIARRTVNFCFASCDLMCGGEIVLVSSGVFKVPEPDKIPEALRHAALNPPWKK
ncbi:MAG: PaaI family thioesterase [Reyranella sp.]|jgi:acyl-coenzyme A thioesterase 13|nr:MAG: PaaI family thioesterase [Reyranella sp.]